MNFFQRRRFLKKANLLDLTPKRMHEHETDENGKVVLMVKKFRNERIARFMLGNRPAHFHIRLDDLGSAVWKEIDGENTVAGILERLKLAWTDAPGKINELEERLSKYLSLLYDNRYIYFREMEDTEK